MYKLNPLDRCNQPCPGDAGRFTAEIERLGKDFNQPLRLAWAPDVYADLWGARRRRYAQQRYGRCEHIRGWWVGAMKEVNGQLLFAPRERRRADRFQQDPHSAFRLDNGDWVQADLEENLIAEPRWIVEFKLPDRERKFHDQERFEYDTQEDFRPAEPKLGIEAKRYQYQDPMKPIDALGPYPEEGKWALHVVIANHWVRCCEQANAENRLCWGVGRAPNENDLAELIKDLTARGRAITPESDDWAARYKEEMRKINDVIAGNLAGQRRAYDEIFDEAIMGPLRHVYMRNNPDKARTVSVPELPGE